MAAIIAFPRAGETDWDAPDYSLWLLRDSADATIIFVSKWLTKSLNRGLRGDAPSEIVLAKAALRFVKKFRDTSMSREYPKAV